VRPARLGRSSTRLVHYARGPIVEPVTRSLIRAAIGLLIAAALGLTGVAAARPAFPLPAGRNAARPIPVGLERVGTAVSTTPRGGALTPARGLVYTGVSCGSASGFAAEVGKHPAVYGEFVNWGQSIHFAFAAAAAAHARLMLHIATGQSTPGHPAITPQGIAQGQGDAYLLGLSKLIAEAGKPIYIRLFPEMNNASNEASAYNLDGSSRGPVFSPAMFIAAWRRVVIVLRGGLVSAIDARLAALGQPPLQGGGAGSLNRPTIAFVWTPETAGTPPIAGNDPINYYPGNAYVDWVGTDFYSRFPNFTGLDRFYKEFPNKPFAFGEWALWGGDTPAFVDQLFAWVNSHRRVQMMIYNQGFLTNGVFRLNLDPLSTAAIRTVLAPARFLANTPEW